MAEYIEFCSKLNVVRETVAPQARFLLEKYVHWSVFHL